MPLRVGTVLKTTFDTYTIQGQLGQGGAGTVYRAADSEGSRHAVKVLNADRATSTVRKRFHNEVHFCSTTEHPHIVKVTDRGITSAEEPFYVMPLYSGSLRTRMTQGIAPTEALPM